MSEYPAGYSSQTSRTKPSNFALPANTGILTPHLAQTNPAKWACRKLVECLYNFEKSLDEEHEVGACLLFLAAEKTLYIDEVSYYDPHLITIIGCDEKGKKHQLVQHVSQLNISFVAIKKRGEDPVRIGFRLKRAAEEDR